MTPILLVEIISALVGLVCLGALTVRFICVRLNRTQGSGAGRERARRHAAWGVGLVAAAAVHGVSATLHASGSHAGAYACGWAALACFVLCAVSMTRFAHLNASESRARTLAFLLRASSSLRDTSLPRAFSSHDRLPRPGFPYAIDPRAILFLRQLP